MPFNWQNEDTVALARDLIGWRLVRRVGRKITRVTIVETEAYHGFDDRASHAARGETTRNRVMFGPGGFWYVYLCYGVHWMANLVTGKEGFPAAILLRGVKNTEGPGRLTRRLAIDGTLNAKPVSRDTGLWLEPPIVPVISIISTPRVGVASSGEWAKKRWRFIAR